MRRLILAVLLMTAIMAMAKKPTLYQLSHLSDSQIGIRCTESAKKMQLTTVGDMVIVNCTADAKWLRN